jgi:Chs5-Arf1p-binding protein BUD7/BCH1
VIAAPSEFGTWARLAEVYVSLEEWELALLTLNSCPMFTYQDKDAPRMPPPAQVKLPVLPDSQLDEIEFEDRENGEAVHPTLRKLHAAGYKGTFLKAYSLLTEITARIGWDQLLKFRSHVFVMEEEYRSEKSHHPQRENNASTTALSGTPEPTVNGNGEEASDNGDGAADSASVITETTVVEPETNGNAADIAAAGLEKPDHTLASDVAKSGGEDVGLYVAIFKRSPMSPGLTQNPQQGDAKGPDDNQFHNKRLCERWLDNLFMVLYEDLRVYTIWRTEMAQYRQQALPYKKSAEEWEILGELAERLHHKEEAIDAYMACLQTRFSPKALKGIAAMQEREGDHKAALASLIRLICWQYRWYSEVSTEPHDFSLLTNESPVVLTSTPLLYPSLDRRRRRRQSPLNSAGHIIVTTCAESHTSLLRALRSF